MDDALVPLAGKEFTVPGEPAAALPPNYRTRRWSIRIGRDWLTISSISESYGVTADRRFTPALAVAAVAGGLALLLAGATAGRALSPTLAPASAAMLVPAARPLLTAPAVPARVRQPVARPAPATVDLADSDADTPAGTQTRSQAIARALATGEFQEWTDRDGTTGFAVPGAAEAGPQGTCRALAVLTRQIDGSDKVASSRECGPAGD